MARSAQLNFVLQQGFRQAAPESCGLQYSALMFQPKLIGFLVLIGLVLQAWPVFLALSVILWWNVLIPKLNLFDSLYNHLIARPRGLPELTPAPGPRRFSQGMAASFMLGIALSLWMGSRPAAWTLEIFLVIALVSLVFGKFCLGSWIFHLIRGEAEFANRTLPWSGSE